MMKSAPGTPTTGKIINNGRGGHHQSSSATMNGGSNNAARQRQQQQQQQQHQYPYRDDPNAPPSVRLESFTRGGFGPTPIHPAMMSNGGVGGIDNEKNKDLSLGRRFWKSTDSCWRRCCRYCTKTSADSRENDDNYYYEDHFNDLSWSCSVGTTDEDGIWLNQNDPAGTIMGILVWILILYSILTVSFLARTSGIPMTLSYVYTILASLSLACHVKTTFTDPGSVPACAVPTEHQRLRESKLSMCSQCQTFKPPLSHHCRICNRCIAKMDHHCPWMNNCIGAGNLKHFLLFLIYTWTSSVFLLLLLGWNYFFCTDDTCVFNVVLTQLVRLMTLLSIGSFLFTSSMLMNVVYGLMTGIGTIDRLKKKATGSMSDSDEEAVPLTDVFGIGPIYTWPFPIDPVFPDYDRVMGYSTPQRLLREQLMRTDSQSLAGTTTTYTTLNGGGTGAGSSVVMNGHNSLYNGMVSGGGGGRGGGMMPV